MMDFNKGGKYRFGSVLLLLLDCKKEEKYRTGSMCSCWNARKNRKVRRCVLLLGFNKRHDCQTGCVLMLYCKKEETVRMVMCVYAGL